MKSKEQVKNEPRRIVVIIGDASEPWDCEPLLYKSIISITVPKKKAKVIKKKIIGFIKVLKEITNVHIPEKIDPKEIAEAHKLENDLCQYNKTNLGLNKKDAKQLAHLMTSGFRDDG